MPINHIQRRSSDLCQLYDVNIDGDIFAVNIDGDIFAVMVTASGDVASAWVHDTIHRNPRGTIVVGIAVQWNYAVGSYPPADIVQLCVGPRCLIFQISRASHVPMALQQFLVSNRCMFVSFWDSNRNMLRRSRHGLRLGRNTLNLRYMMNNEVDQESVQRMVESCLGFRVRLRRDLSMSDWGVPILGEDQCVHASTSLCLPYRHFLSGLAIKDLGRKTKINAHLFSVTLLISSSSVKDAI